MSIVFLQHILIASAHVEVATLPTASSPTLEVLIIVIKSDLNPSDVAFLVWADWRSTS